MGSEIPLGLGMALIQNEAAMRKFERLSKTEKQAVIQQAHGVHSKAEMRQLVAGLGQEPPSVR